MSAPTPTPTPSASEITTGREFLLLTFRCFVGYGVLFVCLLLALRRPPWVLSPADAVYWGTLVAILYLHRRAALAAGTAKQWRVAACWHVAAAAVVWGIGHATQPIH